jgi:hypothetical protein
MKFNLIILVKIKSTRDEGWVVSVSPFRSAALFLFCPNQEVAQLLNNSQQSIVSVHSSNSATPKISHPIVPR